MDDLLTDKKAMVKRIDEQLLTEGDPAKRTLLKLQKISLEYELMKEMENGSIKDFHEPGTGGYG